MKAVSKPVIQVQVASLLGPVSVDYVAQKWRTNTVPFVNLTNVGVYHHDNGVECLLIFVNIWGHVVAVYM